MKVALWDIERVKPYDRNPRAISAKAVDKVAASIRELGFRVAIVVDADGVIIAGHTRLKAAQQLGLKRVPVTVGDDLTPAQVKAYRLADNRVAQESEWLDDVLASELEALQALDFDLAMTGFDLDELNKLLLTEDDLERAEATPEPPEHPLSEPGDLWHLGDHRIICGSSIEAHVVGRLLGKVKPHLMVTDPPYGVEYDASWRDGAGLANGADTAKGKVLNDDQADWREAWALFPGSVAYVWHAGVMADVVYQSLKACKFKIRSQIIWVNPRLAISRGDYHWQHEPCQPAGTLVQKVVEAHATEVGRQGTFADIELVPIETLKDGDHVVSYNAYESVVRKRGRAVTKAVRRDYDGNMHSIRVGDLLTRATAEHSFTVRFSPDAADMHVVYLMRSGERWRVGRCRLFNSLGFGLAVRRRQEGADAAWVLSAHDDAQSAQVAEQVASCVYGIPTTCWEASARQPDKVDVHRNKDHVAAIYLKIGHHRLADGVSRLFSDFGLSQHRPLICADGERSSRSQSKRVAACNLVPGIMQVPVPTDGDNFEWRTIECVEFEPFVGEVYSIDVDKDEHYVADGIVTHNCAFASKSPKDQWTDRFDVEHDDLAYAVKDGNPGQYHGGRKQSTTWHIEHRKSETGHSTQKPIACMQRPIENNSTAGQAIYEPFSGSGTTIMACELSGRIAYAVELHPPYVDVALNRWATFVGGYDKVFLEKPDGTRVPYADVVAERGWAPDAKPEPKPKAKPKRKEKAA